MLTVGCRYLSSADANEKKEKKKKERAYENCANKIRKKDEGVVHKITKTSVYKSKKNEWATTLVLFFTLMMSNCLGVGKN